MRYSRGENSEEESKYYAETRIQDMEKFPKTILGGLVL